MHPSHRFYSWPVVAMAGMAALVAVHGIGRFQFTPIVPVMQAQAGLSINGAAWLASANLLAYLLGSLFTLWKHEHDDKLRWLRRGLFLNAATTFAFGLTDNFALWLLLRTLNGFSNGMVFVYAPALVLDVLSQRGRSAWIGLTFAGVGIGIVLSSLWIMAGPLLQLDWRGLWLVAGAVSLLLSVFAAMVLRPAEPVHAAELPGRSGLAGFGWLAAGYTCAGFGYIISMTFLPVIVHTLPGLEGLASSNWLLVGLAAVPSAFFWSWLGHRIGDYPASWLAYLAQAAGVVLPAWLPTALGVTLSALLVGGTFIGIVLLALRSARRMSPRRSARLIGLLVTLYGIAQMIGPLVAAWVEARSGSFNAALELAAVVLVAGAALLVLARQRQAELELTAPVFSKP